MKIYTVVLALLIVSGTASAEPWYSPGEPFTRHQLQHQNDRHFDRVPITTWPLSPKTNAKTEGGGRISIGGANQTPLFRTFVDNGPREQGELAISAAGHNESAALRLDAQIVSEPADNRRYRFDGSYLAAKPGNWIIGAGAIERWWGPGWESSLVLSNNARPVPGLWLSRNQSYAPEWRWLSWVGPWHFTTFIGQLERDRAIADARLLGARFTFMPLTGLEVGLSRTAQWAGEGRPSNLRSLKDLAVGNTNQTHRLSAGNQLGSIDVRYGFPIGTQSMAFYVQMMGEDEAGAFPAKKSYLGGMDWTTNLLSRSQRWYIEASDTTSDSLFGNNNYNITYEHSGYRTGYRYRGRNIASTYEGDATTVSGGLFHFAGPGHVFSLTVTWADLNRADNVRLERGGSSVDFFVPSERQRVWISRIGYERPLLGGNLAVQFEARDTAIQLMDEQQDRFQVSGSWRYSF